MLIHLFLHKDFGSLVQPVQNIKTNDMLEQTKIVLSNVSFDLSLFRKELLKAIKWLKPSEIDALKIWCSENFSGIYNDICDEIIQHNLICNAN